jgi:hypothetical protein
MANNEANGTMAQTTVAIEEDHLGFYRHVIERITRHKGSQFPLPFRSRGAPQIPAPIADAQPLTCDSGWKRISGGGGCFIFHSGRTTDNPLGKW